MEPTGIQVAGILGGLGGPELIVVALVAIVLFGVGLARWMEDQHGGAGTGDGAFHTAPYRCPHSSRKSMRARASAAAIESPLHDETR